MTGVADRLAGLTVRELAAFAAGCAARVGPVFESFAQVETNRYEEWLTQLWSCAGSLDTVQAHHLQEQLRMAPEASVDDSHRPDYYAMRVFGVLLYGIQVILGSNPIESAILCAEEAISILRDFDYALGSHAGSPRSLVDMEVQAEEEWLDNVYKVSHNIADKNDLENAKTTDVFRFLKEVSTEVAIAHGWDLMAWQRL
jgi:hypothetical protein